MDLNVNQAEAEVESLQQSLLEKDSELREVIREKKKLERRVAGYETTIAQNRGNDYVIDVATKQNTKLLLLLRDEEKKYLECQRELTSEKDTSNMLREKISGSTREFAKIEAELKDNLNRRRHELEKLKEEHGQLQGERGELQKKYTVETRDLHAKVDALTKSLERCKGQPYSLLDRLQQTEDSMRALEGEKDKCMDEVKVLQEQNSELSLHLEDAIIRGNDFKQKMEFLQSNFPPLENELARLRSRVEFERNDKVALNKQVWDMSQAVTSLLSRQTNMEEEAVNKSKEFYQVAKAKMSTEVKASNAIEEKDRHIDKLTRRNTVLTTALEKAKQHLEEIKQEKSRTKYDPSLPFKYTTQAVCRRKLLDMYLQGIANITMDAPGTETFNIAFERLRSLDLSGLSVNDNDFTSILNCLRIAPYIKYIDVSNNDLTDESSYALCTFVQCPEFQLFLLNLQKNQFSAQGIRRIGIALEKNKIRGIDHVLFRKEGLLEARSVPASGNLYPPQGAKKNDEAVLYNAVLEDHGAIAVIDLRNNPGPSQVDRVKAGEELASLDLSLPAKSGRPRTASDISSRSSNSRSRPPSMLQQRRFRDQIVTGVYAPQVLPR